MTSVSVPEPFKVLDGYAECRLVGQVHLEQMVQMATSAIILARERRVSKLLLVIRELTGYASPSISARYTFIKRWADAAQGVVCIAVVTRPERIDPNKFGVTVAFNSGLALDVFTDEEEALAWLLSSQPATKPKPRSEVPPTALAYPFL